MSNLSVYKKSTLLNSQPLPLKNKRKAVPTPDIKPRIMRQIAILLIFLAPGFISFSQATDTLKLINDLKVLKSQIVDKSAQVHKVMEDRQILIDSCQRKISEINNQLATLKVKASKKQQGAIYRKEKELRDINTELDELIKKQSDYKAELDKGNQLIKKLDDSIKALSNGTLQ